mgnify:CR=1 FL=1
MKEEESDGRGRGGEMITRYERKNVINTLSTVFTCRVTERNTTWKC